MASQSAKEINPLDTQSALLASHSDFRLRVQDIRIYVKKCYQIVFTVSLTSKTITKFVCH